MADGLELRLQAVARSLDAEAPVFDAALLDAPRRRGRIAVAALAATVALVGVVAAPAAVSALRDLFAVESVTELDPPREAAPPFLGRSVSPDAVPLEVWFPVGTLPSLGAPTAAYVRDDVMGGMVTLVYGGVALTQWRTADVDTRVQIVPDRGVAEEVEIAAGRPGLWAEGAARGRFTVVGADGKLHQERFEVAPGALLWEDAGQAFLLQGAGSRADALALAAGLER